MSKIPSQDPTPKKRCICRYRKGSDGKPKPSCPTCKGKGTY